MDNKVYCSLEDWDSVLDYYRPNGASKSWYLRETGVFDYPKMWGIWNLFNIEDGNKPFGHDVIVDNVSPNYGDNVIFQTKEEIQGKKHLYIINVFDNRFFTKNQFIGFKCISQQYIDDIKNGRCKIVMIHQFEGYSASSSHNNDLDIINSWIKELELPDESVYYIHGNLLVDKVRKEKGFTIEGLANEANIEYSQLSRIELGKINTTLAQLQIIAIALEVKLTYLLKEL